ncbi:hypothetical protein DLP37_25300 [Salmonella enterica]|nr:hypothetical protein [Salmonella enterica]
MHHRTPLRFRAHSLATLGHEAAASATTAITRKPAPLLGGTGKTAGTPTAQKSAEKALLSDKAICALPNYGSYFDVHPASPQ